MRQCFVVISFCFTRNIQCHDFGGVNIFVIFYSELFLLSYKWEIFRNRQCQIIWVFNQKIPPKSREYDEHKTETSKYYKLDKTFHICILQIPDDAHSRFDNFMLRVFLLPSCAARTLVKCSLCWNSRVRLHQG